jgi:GNAT superfamily N-acetyltransferase
VSIARGAHGSPMTFSACARTAAVAQRVNEEKPEVNSLRRGLWLLRKRHYRPLLRRLRLRAWSDTVSIGLDYDPRVQPALRMPRIPVEVRPIRPGEIPAFTDLPGAGAPRTLALTRANARYLLESGLQTCYVGLIDDEPAYMQFLITADQNERLSEVFDGRFPPLADGEALLEFAFTLPEHRARPVMPTVLLRLIELAAEQGARRVVAYSQVENAKLIRFFLRLGFAPFCVRTDKWRLLVRRVEFRPADSDLVERLARPEVSTPVSTP